jgi:hypothetical protein
MGEEKRNMKRRRLRIGSLVVLVGLLAAIPASTQVLFGSTDNAEGSNLPLLILVNRMELTAEQMVEIHGLLEGLLEEREALEVRRAELEEDMVSFTGTAAELDEILEAFRAESAGQAESARERVGEVIDQIKGVLTLKQGELLAEALPGLLGGRGASLPFGRQDRSFELGLRERLSEQLRERFAGNPEVLERLRQRLGGHEQTMGRTLRGRCRLGAGLQRSAVGVGGQVLAQRRGLDWIEQLVEVLELKLEAVG